MEYGDAQIIDRVLGGDIALFEILIRRNNPFLYKIGRSYGYNHQDTQDLMQDSFVDAFKSLSQFEGRSSFKTWIIRVMLNNCFRRRQKFSVKNEIVREIAEDSRPMFSGSDNENAYKMVVNEELRSVIERALIHMPLDYRMTFSLREVNGLNVAETAEVLGISQANVKVRLNRAKAMLRKEIEKEYLPQDIFEFNLVYCSAILTNVSQVVDIQLQSEVVRCNIKLMN
jgi:RNA polymerase sigma-70 factor (ECF subfamily)